MREISDIAGDLLLIASVPLCIGAFGFISGWLEERKRVRTRDTLITTPVETSAGSEPQAPHTRIGVLEVMNGRVLEVCSFKRNPHGPDWTTTYWILNEEQPLAEQIAVVLAMKGLAK